MTCGTQFGRNNAGEPHDEHGCILEAGHKGPHKFIAADGVAYEWETDMSCTCSHCMQFDGDYCTIYWEST